jgi:hypothetical protein
MVRFFRHFLPPLLRSRNTPNPVLTLVIGPKNAASKKSYFGRYVFPEGFPFLHLLDGTFAFPFANESH